MNEDISSEDLVDVGFTSFGEIEDLNEETILNEEVFKYVLLLDDPILKIKVLAKLKNRARQLKQTKSFNDMLKAYQNKYSQMSKQSNSKTMNFTEAPLEKLKCGEWNCKDTGVSKIIMGATSPIQIVACSHPILPIERLVNIDTNTEKIKLAFYKDNKWQYVVVEKGTIASKNRILQLANRGIEVNENNAKDLITYLSDVLNLNMQEIPYSKSITHLGWINDKEFAPYSEEYKYDGDASYKTFFESVTTKGSYDDWKDYIRKLRKDNITLRFMMASSFASVLVKIFKINPFIVHLWGKSSNGKTVSQMICASIWGNPAKGKLLSSLDNTKVASERMLNFLKHLPLIADELQLTKNIFSNYDTLIYVLTEGKGKDRGTVDNGLTNVTEWDNIIITSGEEPITSSNAKEGVKNRVFEIEENNTIIENGRETVAFIQKNYGWAGKEFIEVIKQKEELFEEYDQIIEQLKNITESKKQINAMGVILLADKIVSEKIFDDDKLRLEEVKDYFTKDIDEADRYIELILDVINRNINNFIDIKKDYIPSGQVWGKINKEKDPINQEYEIISYDVIPTILYDVLKENCINWNGIKKKMADKGYVVKSSDGKYLLSSKIKDSVQRVIRINNIHKNDLY